MIFWNFRTPLTLLACLIWNASEFFHIPLGKSSPTIFHLALGCKKKKKLQN